MNDKILLLACALFLLLTVCLGLFRVVRGPAAADRMLSAQLFGTSGVGIFLLLAEVLEHPTLRHIALVYALLAAVAVITFVRRYRGDGGPTAGQPDAGHHRQNHQPTAGAGAGKRSPDGG